jgi:hypothetical protein
MWNPENPVLKRELRIRIRPRKLIPALLSRFAFLGITFPLILLARLGRGLLAFSLAETFLIVLFAPGSVLDAFSSRNARNDLRELCLTRLNPVSILLGKFIGVNFYNFVVIILSALAMCFMAVFHKNLHIWNLIRVNLSILALLSVSSATALILSVISQRNAFISVISTYFIVILLISSIITFGPLIGKFHKAEAKNALSKLALYTNPFVMTSRSLGNVDIMRTRYMYELADPIVSRGFSYPEWYYPIAIYFLSSCVFMAFSLLGFRSFAYQL